MDDGIEHVYSGCQAFGFRHVRASCSCGYLARPVDGRPEDADASAAARWVFFAEHEARDLGPDEPASALLIGRPGNASPSPERPSTGAP